MKKIIAFFALVGTTVSFAQTPPSWSNGGNNAATNDFIGTTNNTPLNFKTNNNLQMVLGTDGSLKMNKFVGTTDRILMVDANGFLRYNTW